MNSSSLSAEDLRTCVVVSPICPMRSWRQGLRSFAPHAYCSGQIS
jgi:hypothetical protein